MIKTNNETQNNLSPEHHSTAFVYIFVVRKLKLR